MNQKSIKLISLFLLTALLYACNDNATQSNTSEQGHSDSDEEVATLKPYLDESVIEAHSSGERKIGLYSETNGQGIFEDCKTGKMYLVDISSATNSLHSSYTLLTPINEQKLLVELTGEIPPDRAENQTFKIQKLLGIIHLHNCPQTIPEY